MASIELVMWTVFISELLVEVTSCEKNPKSLFLLTSRYAPCVNPRRTFLS